MAKTTIKSTPQRQMLSIQASADISLMRTATMHGAEYTVIPCIALVEGVLWPSNAEGPELALAEEFGRVPAAWDGCPLVMNHPSVEGIPVSANIPSIMEDYAFGAIYNTKLVDGKLHTEMWINNARVEAMGGEVQETVARLTDLESGEIVEVSTGLFSRSEEIAGLHNNEEYVAIWRNIIPDHLAVLSKGTLGACSGEDGCGAPRTNSMKPVMRAMRMGEVKETPVPLIDNGKIKADIKAACSCGGHVEEPTPMVVENENKVFAKLREMAGSISSWGMSLRSNAGASLSDSDTREAIRAALSTEGTYAWIMAVFQESPGVGKVVYESGYEGKLYERSFSIAAEGGVSLGAEILEVRPVTQFVPVTINAGKTANVPSVQETKMLKKDQVAALIANAATKFTEKDTDFLMGLEEAQLELLEPVVNAAPVTPVVKPIEPEVDDEPVTLSSYLANAPAEVRSVMNSAIQLQTNHRKSLCTGIIANKRNKFTQVQLEGFDLATLENLAEMAEVSSYAGTSIGQGTLLANAEGDDYAEPTSLIKTLAAGPDRKTA